MGVGPRGSPITRIGSKSAATRWGCCGSSACAVETSRRCWGRPLRRLRAPPAKPCSRRRGCSTRRIWVGLSPDGKITLYSGAAEIGEGVSTVLTQICADALGVSLSEVRLVMGEKSRRKVVELRSDDASSLTSLG